MSAPHFAELEWSPVEAGGWIAKATPELWSQFNLQRAGFKWLGFVISKSDDRWIVTGPDIDDTNRKVFHELLAGISGQRNEAADRNRAALQEQDAIDDA